ncbi:MAG: Chromosome partition protein Smc [Candidatus Heimdallarchaeota archaeon LC_2]|nr:MAG: Chromosome partition protein Smc [Candidatus Heimdallarchaeota archaeon LC_2]
MRKRLNTNFDIIIPVQGNINIEDTIAVVRNFLHVGDINEALVNLELIMDLREITERQEQIVDILNVRILMELGQNVEALALVEAASYGLAEDRFKIEFVELKALRAMLYFLSSKFDESDVLIIETLKLVEKFNENDRILCEESVSEISNLRGLIYSNNSSWDQALVEFLNALGYRKRANHRKEIGMILFNLANAYRYQDNIQRCITILEESISTFKDINYIEGMEASYNSIKDVYTQIGETDSAFLYKQKLDELSEKITFKNYKRETTIQRNTQAREIEKLNAEIIQNKQEIWSLGLELNSSQDASNPSESFSTQIGDNMKQELSEKRDEVTLISKELELLKNRITSIEKENEQLKNSSKSQDDNMEIKQELVESLHKIDSLDELINHKTKEIETLNNLVGKKNSETNEMQSVIDEYKTKIDELEGNQESAHVEINNLKNELKETKENVVSVSSESELKEAKKKIEDLEKQFAEKPIVSDDKNLKKELEDAKQTSEKLMKDLKERESQTDENLKQIEITFEELEKAKIKIKELQSSDHSQAVVDTDSKLIQEKESQINKLEAEIEDIHKVNRGLEKNLQEKDAKHLIEMQNLKTEMKSKVEPASSPKSDEKLNELKDQIAELENQIKVKETLLENSNLKNEELNNKIESLEEKAKELKSVKEEVIIQKPVEIPPQTIRQTVVVSTPKSADSTIQDLLDSSKLAETIASILNEQSQLKLRFLAMQIGTSPARIMDEVKQLRDVGFVDLQYDSAGDSNPLIVKK